MSDEKKLKDPHQLYGEFSAVVWARVFVETVKKHPDIVNDEMTMVGWFANAIMTGYDRGSKGGA